MRLSPSSDALNSGNFFSADTQTLIRNASMVTLMPAFSFSLLSRTRSASRSVISASSLLVTFGVMTQLRCRFAPAIFLIRDSGFTSMGPNLAKSTFGHGNRPSAAPPADHAAAQVEPADAPLITSLTNFCTSSRSTRSLGPLPFTRDRSTPSSRASARTDGEAWAFLKLALATGGAAPAGALGAFLFGGEDA